MDPLSFPLLLDKYLTDALTPAEERAFFALLEQAPNREILRQAIDARAEGGDYSTELPFDTSDYEGLEAVIEARTAANAQEVQKVEESQKPRDARILPLYWRLAGVAAAILLLVGAGSLLMLRKSRPTAPASQAGVLKSPVHPGAQKAILQLGNGSTIVLDSAHEGLLASQGGVQVVKTDSGQLRYLQGAANGTGNGAANPGAVVYNQISTPRGGQYQLVLPDGSRVWLNAASSIRFPTAFASPQRTVTITGEAYFEVAQNKEKPFFVQTGGVTVEVLGTHFNIMAYPDEAATKTTLLEGAVRVRTGGEARLLSPGQQALAAPRAIAGAVSGTVPGAIPGTGPLSVVSVDTAQVVAWKNGLFEFDHLDLGTIMRQISRWYDVDIRYNGVDTAARFDGGISRKLDLQDVLSLLEGSGVQFKLENRTLTVIH